MLHFVEFILTLKSLRKVSLTAERQCSEGHAATVTILRIFFFFFGSERKWTNVWPSF